MAEPHAVPIEHSSVQTDSPTARPLHYAIVIFPGVQTLDFAGPLDTISLLKTLPRSFFPDATTKTSSDSTIPGPDSKRDLATNQPPGPPLTLQILAPTLSAVSSSPHPTAQFAQSFLPTDTFSNHLSQSASSRPAIDVLLVPGGIGTRFPSPASESAMAETISFVATVAPSVRVAIMSICTGAVILGRAGLLTGRDGIRATTNKNRFSVLAEKWPRVSWEWRARWVKDHIELPREPEGLDSKSAVHSDNSVPSDSTSVNPPHPTSSTASLELWTAAGILAGVDCTLAFIAEKYGLPAAVEVARRLEHDWDPERGGSEEAWKEFYGDKYFS